MCAVSIHFPESDTGIEWVCRVCVVSVCLMGVTDTELLSLLFREADGRKDRVGCCHQHLCLRPVALFHLHNVHTYHLSWPVNRHTSGKITNIERGGGDNTPGQTVHSQAIVVRWPYFQHTHLLLLYGVILKPGEPVARATQGYSLTECVKSIGKQWKRNHSTMPRGTIDPPYIKGMLPECFSVTWGLTNKETWQGKLLLFHELQFSAGLAHSTPQAFSTAEVLPYSHRKLSQAG